MARCPVRLILEILVPQDSQVTEVMRQLIWLKHELLLTGKALDHQQATGFQRCKKALYVLGLGAVNLT